MCGIFALLNYVRHKDKNQVCAHIQKYFMEGKARGPEKSTFQYHEKQDIFLGFHRLAINGYGKVTSEQPLSKADCILICNGEIYNWKQLSEQMKVECTSGSDCEIIIHAYRAYGIQHTLQMLDGVFSFLLWDTKSNQIYVARDTFGVRPLFMWTYKNFYMKNIYLFASEMKMALQDDHLSTQVIQFPPGTVSTFSYSAAREFVYMETSTFSQPNSFTNYTIQTEEDATQCIRKSLQMAVVKRIDNTDRDIACLLSGGLDSSLVAALVAAEYKTSEKTLHTWSIGMHGSEDLKYAKLVADHIGSIHHSIELTEEEFLAAIGEVIYAIESNDTTTIRASVGNWLICKHIKQKSVAKVIFNGDGSDEVCGGYLYFHYAPDMQAFDQECRRLLRDISYFDVLRSDRSISSHGLEARTPFLDRNFVQNYLSIPVELRAHPQKKQCEKYLLRKAFEGTNLLPKEVLWRTKEAFSDGVSQQQRSWYEVIQQYALTQIPATSPAKAEQVLYDQIYQKYYGPLENKKAVLPYKWMPRFVEASDASARTLAIYHT